MNERTNKTLGQYSRLEEAATFFLWSAFDHAYMAAQLEVAGLIFGERIMSIDPEPGWEIPPLPDTLLGRLNIDVEILPEITIAQLGQAWEDAQNIAPRSGRKLDKRHPIQRIEIVGHVIDLAACVESSINRHLFLLRESGRLSSQLYASLDRTEVIPKILFAFKESVIDSRFPIGRLKYLYKLRNQAVHFKASSTDTIKPTSEDLLETWRDVGHLFELMEGEPTKELVVELAQRVSNKWFE